MSLSATVSVVVWPCGQSDKDQLAVWRALKGLRGGTAEKIVMSVGSQDGFEAWRRLHLQYEPRLVIRQGQVLGDVAAMVMKPATSIGDSGIVD